MSAPAVSTVRTLRGQRVGPLFALVKRGDDKFRCFGVAPAAELYVPLWKVPVA